MSSRQPSSNQTSLTPILTRLLTLILNKSLSKSDVSYANFAQHKLLILRNRNSAQIAKLTQFTLWAKTSLSSVSR